MESTDVELNPPETTQPSAAELLKSQAQTSPDLENDHSVQNGVESNGLDVNGHDVKDVPEENGLAGQDDAHDLDAEIHNGETDRLLPEEAVAGTGEPPEAPSSVSDLDDEGHTTTEAETTTADEDESGRNSVIERPPAKSTLSDEDNTQSDEMKGDKTDNETQDAGADKKSEPVPIEADSNDKRASTHSHKSEDGKPATDGENGVAAAVAAGEQTPLTETNGDVETGLCDKDLSEDSDISKKESMLLARKEVLLCMLGGTAFLIGLIMIIIGLMVMQTKCDRSCHEEDGHTFHAALSSEHLHVHDHGDAPYKHENSTVELVNLALGRKASQSSVWRTDEGVQYNASLSTDGNVRNKFNEAQCAQTGFEQNAFWYVDLGSTQTVGRLTIVIPGDCCGGELHDFVIQVGDNADVIQNAFCRHFMGSALKHRFDVPCNKPISGRYVSIRMLGDEARPRDRLTLCEVMVFSS